MTPLDDTNAAPNDPGILGKAGTRPITEIAARTDAGRTVTEVPGVATIVAVRLPAQAEQRGSTPVSER